MTRTTADIIAELSEADQAAVAKHMARIELELERKSMDRLPDANPIDALLRILKSPNPQAERLRELIEGIATNG